MSNDLQETIILESMKTMNKIKESKENKSTTLYESFSKNKSKFDKGAQCFEEFTIEEFENKLKVDMMYYNQLMEKLEEDKAEQAGKLISSLYKTVKEIYEHINIKPEIYGKSIIGEGTTILNESVEKSKVKMSKVIYGFLESSFYKFPPEERVEKYKDFIKEDVTQLIQEGVDTEESIIYSTKKCVMENLIKNIAIPNLIQKRIDYLVEDEDYGKVFDVDRLKDLVEQYNERTKNLSKVVAACV